MNKIIIALILVAVLSFLFISPVSAAQLTTASLSDSTISIELRSTDITVQAWQVKVNVTGATVSAISISPSLLSIGTCEQGGKYNSNEICFDAARIATDIVPEMVLATVTLERSGNSAINITTKSGNAYLLNGDVVEYSSELTFPEQTVQTHSLGSALNSVFKGLFSFWK